MPSRNPVELPQLLERIDPHVRVRADAQRDPALAHATDGDVPVPEVGFGRGADADSRARLRDEIEFSIGRMRRMDDGRARREATCTREQLNGANAVLGQALLDLARLLACVDVQHELFAGNIAPDLLEPVLRTCANGVGGEADAQAAIAQRLDLAQVLGRRLLPELREPPASVRRVQEHELDPHLDSSIGGRDGLLETEVVELADRRVAAVEELAIDADVVGANARGRLLRRKREHRVAPAPEVRALTSATQSALEGVAV